MSRIVNKDGQKITNEDTKTKALSKSLTSLAMHAHLVAKKLDENLIPIAQHKIDKHIRDLVDAIGEDESITLYLGFGLFVAMNPEEAHGIPDEFTKKAFGSYMKILNSIEEPGDKDELG